MTSAAEPAPVEVHHVVEDGPAGATPLVLSHSLGTDHTVWDSLVPRLARSRRVVRYDHRGHGHSPVPRGPYALADLGHDVLALLDRLELPRVSFAGVSLGGMVGLWLAAHAPERIDRLVVCCASAYLDNPEEWADRAATVRSNGTVAIAEGVVHHWFAGGFAAAHRETVDHLVLRFAGTADEGYAACCEAIGAMDLRPDLSRIEAPTLVVAARDDAALPRDHARTIATRLPRAELTVVDDAGHLAVVEAPAAIAGLVQRHLEARPVGVEP